MLWAKTKSTAVVQSSNHLARDVHSFHELLGIEADPRSWEAKQLGAVGKVGAQAIQGTKDAAPFAGAVAGLVAVAVAGVKARDQE